MNQHEAGASVPALRTERLGRRYGKVWGLRDCTLEVPAAWALTSCHRRPAASATWR